jgi:hypothetical protein
MQQAMLNRATTRVANTTEVSGRVTADEVNLDRFHNRIRKVCALVAATLILPALAYAQNNQGDNQLAALQAQITALQKQVNTLQTELNAVLSSNVYALNPFVAVDPPTFDPKGVKAPNIVFSGANIHIVSGSGATDDGTQSNPGTLLSGLGNLIIGYDETNGNQIGRDGSHNLVIGRFHSFTSSAFGGLVAGEGNTIKNGLESVMGGLNTVSGYGATICGGLNNTVTATGTVAVVVGGANTVQNVVPNNTASGFGAVVIGGAYQMAIGTNSIAPQNLLLFP